MDFSVWLSFTLLLTLSFLLSFSRGATFTFANKCDYTVWPGILANAGSPSLGSTGFELSPDSSRSFQAPTGWSGRFWGRTGCNFGSTQPGFCSTGDCGSGKAECEGAGAAPPATLAEFTLSAGTGQDFYDVSLVDGYNLPMLVEPSSPGSGSGECATTGCVVDLNRVCPNELRVGDGEACKSACEAFGSPKYCCSGAYGSPATCKPSVYSQVFKSACPRSYSYAYDDATSTFTCNAGAGYTITFCPSATPSQKSTTSATPVTAPTTTATTPGVPPGSGSGSQLGLGGSMNYDDGSVAAGAGSQFASSSTGIEPEVTGSGSSSQSTAMLTDGSWLANLAMGDAAKKENPTTVLTLSAAALSLLSFLSPYLL